MVDVPKDKPGWEEFSMLQVDELFFPRNKEGEIIPKRISIKVDERPEVIKVKKIVKDKQGKELKDKDGKVIEKEVDETILHPIMKDILITPLARGEWLEMTRRSKDGETTKDQDTEIIEGHVLEPKVKAEDLRNTGRSTLINLIVTKILEYSSLITEPDSKKKVVRVQNQQEN